MNMIRINYTDGSYTLIYFDKELNQLQMYSAEECIGKTIKNIINNPKEIE